MISKRVLIAFLCCALVGPSLAEEPTVGIKPASVDLPSYRLHPGDIITVSVWKETDLQAAEVLVRPDGGFSFPLAGEVEAAGKTVDEIRGILTERLKRYIPSPVVTVAVKQIMGNRIYVVGRVNRAGDFPLSSPIDVMQAIALAGGMTPFAAINDIVILRRQNGQQQAIRFHYSDVARGRDLSQNVLLQGGDTVVVP
jgi:polysaccharide export outer membrane protein